MPNKTTMQVMEEIHEMIKRAEGGRAWEEADKAAICVREVNGGYQIPRNQLKTGQQDCHMMIIPWTTKNMVDAANIAQVWWIKFIDGEPSYERIF